MAPGNRKNPQRADSSESLYSLMEFQRDFPLAAQAWKAAQQANDVKAAQGAEAMIVDLATSLTALAAQVVTAVGEGGVNP